MEPPSFLETPLYISVRISGSNADRKSKLGSNGSSECPPSNGAPFNFLKKGGDLPPNLKFWGGHTQNTPPSIFFFFFLKIGHTFMIDP